VPTYDKEFGIKLKALERAVGFRFPASDFSTTFLATLLDTAVESMSRKKTGKRRLTESDCSKLTSYFDLARYGFEPDMFALDLQPFEEIMREVGRKAQRDAKPNKAREDLFQLATSPDVGGRLWIGLARSRVRSGGIGSEPKATSLPVFIEGDRVEVHVSVPKDGYLILLNDDREQVTCLMPSHYAPLLAVRGGDVVIPNSADFPHFPVGGPANNYRLYAVWFAQRPSLALTAGDFKEALPRDIDSTEFLEVVECAKQASRRSDAIMVAFGDYKVK
jgi:hypothetical protein